MVIIASAVLRGPQAVGGCASRPIGAGARLASRAPGACDILPTGLFCVHCAVTTRPGLGLERRLSNVGEKVLPYPNNDRLFYLCPRCESAGVNWCGMKDLQGRKLFVCEKDERHITTLERLKKASGKRRLLD